MTWCGMMHRNEVIWYNSPIFLHSFPAVYSFSSSPSFTSIDSLFTTLLMFTVYPLCLQVRRSDIPNRNGGLLAVSQSGTHTCTLVCTFNVQLLASQFINKSISHSAQLMRITWHTIAWYFIISGETKDVHRAVKLGEEKVLNSYPHHIINIEGTRSS